MLGTYVAFYKNLLKFKIKRRRSEFRLRQSSNANQSALLTFKMVPIDFCAICKDSYQICDVELVKTGHLKSIISKNKNDCYFCSLFGD